MVIHPANDAGTSISSASTRRTAVQTRSRTLRASPVQQHPTTSNNVGANQRRSEFNQMRETISALQDQVNDLYASLNELRNRGDLLSYSSHIDPQFSQDGHARSLSMSRTLPPLISPKRSQNKVLPPFHGPTSTLYGLDVAKSSLQTMGITHTAPDDGPLSRERSRAASPVVAQIAHPTKDPLWLIDHAEVVRLCRVYEEEIGIMYPIVNIDKMLKHAGSLYTFIQASLRSGFGDPRLPGADTFDDEETTVLKMVLSVTLTVEGHGRSDLGKRFFDAAKPATDLKLVTAVDLKSVVLTVMTVRVVLQRNRPCRLLVFRLHTTSRRMKKHRRGGSLASQPGCASKWDCIGRSLWSSRSQMRQNINKPSGSSGRFTLSTDAGASARACHLHCRILILIQHCLSR
jgi:hypothetical protein